MQMIGDKEPESWAVAPLGMYVTFRVGSKANLLAPSIELGRAQNGPTASVRREVTCKDTVQSLLSNKQACRKVYGVRFVYVRSIDLPEDVFFTLQGADFGKTCVRYNKVGKCRITKKHASSAYESWQKRATGKDPKHHAP